MTALSTRDQQLLNLLSTADVELILLNKADVQQVGKGNPSHIWQHKVASSSIHLKKQERCVKHKDEEHCRTDHSPAQRTAWQA